MPPVGAGPFNVTVPVEDAPPRTVAGDTVTPVSSGGVTVKVALAVLPASEPVIVAVTDAKTAEVVIANVAVVAPAVTVTDVGGVALPELDVKLMTNPALGAMPFRVTVPVADVPPITEAGVIDKPVSAGGLMVSVADCVAPP